MMASLALPGKKRDLSQHTRCVSPCDALCYVVMQQEGPFQMPRRCQGHAFGLPSLWNHKPRKPILYKLLSLRCSDVQSRKQTESTLFTKEDSFCSLLQQGRNFTAGTAEPFHGIDFPLTQGTVGCGCSKGSPREPPLHCKLSTATAQSWTPRLLPCLCLLCLRGTAFVLPLSLQFQI